MELKTEDVHLYKIPSLLSIQNPDMEVNKQEQNCTREILVKENETL
jgi:hypothetical protein